MAVSSPQKSFHHGQKEEGAQLPSRNTSNIVLYRHIYLTQMLYNIILFKGIYLLYLHNSGITNTEYRNLG